MASPHRNFVIAPMIIKFGTGMKLDRFYTVPSLMNSTQFQPKKFMTPLLLRNYDVITCISADAFP